jgi:hypothetical protein
VSKKYQNIFEVCKNNREKQFANKHILGVPDPDPIVNSPITILEKKLYINFGLTVWASKFWAETVSQIRQLRKKKPT